jgi:hypothetical protein
VDSNALAAGDFNADGKVDLASLGGSAVIVLLNQPAGPVSSWQNLGGGIAGDLLIPKLSGSGAQIAGEPVMLNLSAGSFGAAALLLVGLANNPVPFKGGMLVPTPVLLTAPLLVGLDTKIALPLIWPAGLPSGFNIYYQIGIQDIEAVQGIALSNALKSTTP